jgi:hypothetical protein
MVELLYSLSCLAFDCFRYNFFINNYLKFNS